MDKLIEQPKLNRFSEETNTCNPNLLYKGFLDGFFGKFQDSFFYTFVIQFIIVTLMYINVGKGRYWKVLIYAATAGLLGSFLENGTVAILCLEGNKDVNYRFVPSFLICEFFWIPCEYAIPYLNLIKMKAFAKGRFASFMKYLIIFLTFPFILFRLLIGYERMKKGYLQDPSIRAYHGFAFSVMALADIICTFCILYFVKQNNTQCVLKASNINNYIKHSSYTTLVTVDIVSAILSTLNIIANIGPFKDDISSNIITPLHCLKCSFTLILAADALIFKYGANTSSLNESNNSRTYGLDSFGNSFSVNNYKNTTASHRSRNFSNGDIGTTMNMISMNSSTSINGNPTGSKNKNRMSQNYNINNTLNNSSNNSLVSPYNISTLDGDFYNRANPKLMYPKAGKTIVKNYTTVSVPTSPISPSDDSDKTFEINVYQNQNFGFLNQQ